MKKKKFYDVYELCTYLQRPSNSVLYIKIIFVVV